MFIVRWLSALIVGIMIRVLFCVEVTGVDNVPLQGGVIIASNHVNFFDAPILFTTFPRRVIPVVKEETWKSPVLGPIFSAWHGIPIRRGELDLNAFRSAVRVLKDQQVLGIAVEGTRSNHGRLQQGRPGIVALAAHAPDTVITPVAVNGLASLYTNLRHLRRTAIHVAYGPAFCLRSPERRMSHDLRQEITDEIMAQIAALMPAEYRGVYADSDPAAARHLCFVTHRVANMPCLTPRSAIS